MSISQSIFDSKDVTNYKLWSKKLPGLKTNDTISFSLSAAKKSKKGESYDSRPFYITKTGFLYYKKSKDSSAIRGAMDLKWARACFEKLSEEETAGSKYTYSLMIVKNLKFTNLYLEDEEAVETWRKALSKHVALTDFHQRYSVLSMIGKGAFAKVTQIQFSLSNLFTFPSSTRFIISLIFFEGCQS